ncbi:ribosomal protein S6 kinase-related protein-like [Acipenser oxyrinchus oxyrinchus]|uniref:Ribosomal protein S6 kinase-related protein-like n=1 Tax=Acipenser oxyrinchus oxyrinchus TaxID=40147 RepID=A0AAD8CTG2_ACIOX|nr:ribosomal protein S6 kinase-related protein-like [Acipenser oxyrinchus oxyrinchus]
MGADVSHNNNTEKGLLADNPCGSGWRGLLSSVGNSLPTGLCQFGPFRFTRRKIKDKPGQGPELLPLPPPLPPSPGKDVLEWPLSGFISLFLPEFPHRSFPGKERFQILDCIAKGSYGPILKVKDRQKEKTCAVLLKSEILRQRVLEQSKEEVIIQRLVQHPFLHDLQDCWQTLRHLFIMCEYCSTGDLHTYWSMIGQFGEDAVQVFAAELGSAVGFLHDFGIIHRDIKVKDPECVLLSGHLRLADFGLSRRLERGGKAYTICGTMQYMAPEVLSGGPYNHAADWWSLGILLFSLAAGTFPVSAETDHSSMLRMVRRSEYDMPSTFSPQLSLLLSELLCKNPVRRLHHLDRFQKQLFFRGTTFDTHLLQKNPMGLILELKKQRGPGQGQGQDPFQNFDCDLTEALNLK